MRTCAFVVNCAEGFGKKSRWMGGDAVYIYCERPSRLGNPYLANEAWQKEVERLIEWLREKEPAYVYLGCWCAPKACHADEIARRINELWTID